MSVVLAVAAGLLACFILPYLLKEIWHQLRTLYYGSKLNGPYAYPLIGCAHHLAFRDISTWMDFLVKEGKKVRDRGEGLMRFWNINLLYVFPLTGKAAKDILDSSEEITKGNGYTFIKPWLGDGLLISTNEKWRQRRKMLTPTFHFEMLDSYVQTFGVESDILVDILSGFSDSGKKIDIFPYIKRCALDIICGTAMGKTYQAQVNKNHPYVLAVDGMTALTMFHELYPLLWLPPVWYLGGYQKQYKSLLHTLKSFTVKVIAEREEEVKENGFEFGAGRRKAFLDMLLEMKEQNHLTDSDIREEVDTFMFEGHDTTSCGIAWTLWCLACHPEIQQKVHQEIMEVMGPSGEITVSHLKQLNYLERATKEAMRIFPPVPLVQRKLQKDFESCGKIIPKGSHFMIPPILIHYNEEAFPDPYKYDPDRFLPENCEGRNAYDYVPFSAGLRNCVGQKFAMYEEKTVVSSIIRNFEVTTDIDFLDNLPSTEVVLKPSRGVQVYLKRRN